MTDQWQPNFSWVTVVQDGEDDFVIGNGLLFVYIPEVGGTLIKLLDRFRTIAEADYLLGKRLGMEVDALDFFVQTLRNAPILDRPPVQHSQCEKLRPNHVIWLFSWPSFSGVAFLVVSSLITFVTLPYYFARYSSVYPLSIDFHGYFSYCHLDISISSQNESHSCRVFVKHFRFHLCRDVFPIFGCEGV
ncbi:hypothetical protein [Sulfobacillus thermosulfidooxidans]|uniref:hypothetical protein n=1 Tax=Sulfobacillus thermosulfidooxidans TaxID=28034 RepID=UPI000B03871C|nr:hypothetical protein [Sulfobacillus thermosulfidooxidans]